MAVVRTIKCDACGKEAPLDSFTGKWYNVSTMVSNSNELLSVMREHGIEPDHIPDEEERKRYVDGAECCSLPCVANWASAQAGMRELEL